MCALPKRSHVSFMLVLLIGTVCKDLAVSVVFTSLLKVAKIRNNLHAQRLGFSTLLYVTAIKIILWECILWA